MRLATERNHSTAESYYWAAPFVLRYQPVGAPWTGAARLDVAVGAALAAAGFGGFFTALAGRIRDLYVQADTAQEPGGALE
jgi:hypothetical protein